MRIIHIITSLEKGGAEEMLRRLLKANHQNPVESTLVITLTGQVHHDEELRKCGYEILELNITGLISLIAGIVNLYFKILKFKPEFIQTWLYHSDLIGGIVGKLAFVPFIIWNIRCEALNVHRAGLKTMIVFNLCKIFSYIVPTKIICVGEKAKNSHIKSGFCKSKMEVIFNGYETDKFVFSEQNRKKIRRELQVEDAELLVGCIGRYHQDKGQDILLKAAIEILSYHQNIKFVFVGRNCTYENPEISAYINPSFKNKILLVGEKRNVSEILSSFDLYCMPSRSEGFPNSLAEAMLTEIPCIATNVGDTSNLAGDSVILIEPNDADLLVSKINEFTYLNRQERKIIGNKAREQVVNNFSIEKARENFNFLYSKILER